jgi:hypothetical protein
MNSGFRVIANQPSDPELDDPGLFRRWTTPELMAEPDDFSWLIKGLLADPTYGQIAGEMKTLKTYVSGFIAVGLASGMPIFGRFKPAMPMPVLAYVGEGGRLPYTRRLRRIAEAVGVNLAHLPLEVTFDVKPILSLAFQESLARDLLEVQPGLVLVDPFYAYHGAVVKASDLHGEGALLNALSKPVGDAGVSLLVANHFNQTGGGLNLKRITMAGSGEWADSWLLLAHRTDPDVENGRFFLTMQIGSRQWGGTTWDLDLNIGRFNEDLGTHDGDITWDLRRSNGSSTTPDKTGNAKATKARHAICEALADKPWQLTKTDLYAVVGGNRDVFHEAITALADGHLIKHDHVGREEAGTTKRRLLWGLNPNPDQSDGPCSTTEEA